MGLSWTVFLLVHTLPGNPFSGSERMTDQREALLLHRAGLDQSWPIQYVHWLQSYFAGGMAPILWHEASISIRLGLLAMALILGLGFWVGVNTAARRGSRFDIAWSAFASFAYAVPNFVWAIGILFFFSSFLFHWTGGLIYVEIGWGSPVQWFLPALALALPQAGLVAKLVRTSVLETLGSDYVRTARAKGLEERVVLLRHALRNSLIPVLTLMGPIAVTTLMGSIVVEKVFSVPGLGSELVGSILARSYFTVTGVFTYYSLLAGLAMLIIDLTYTVLDPKIRY